MKLTRFFRSHVIDFMVGVLLTLLFTVMMSFTSYGQSNIGINNPNPHSKSLLDLTATDKGLLAPRMTQAQRLLMFPSADATAKGMLVYQTDNTQGFYYYDGAVWQFIANGISGWGLTGNAGTSAATNFFGTTDNNDLSIKTNSIEDIHVKTNGKVGIGTNNPAAGFSSARVEIADETGSNSDLAMRVAGGGYPTVILEASNGTLAAPTQSSSGAWAGYMMGQVYDGTQYINTAAMIFGTEGVNSVNNVKGTIQFNTNQTGPNGNEKMRLSAIGNLGVGVTNPLNRLDVGGNTNVMLDSNYRINNTRVLATKGTANLFTGLNAGIANTSGGYNTFVGHYSGYVNTSGGSNAFFGQASGVTNTTGNWNTFLGNASGYNNITGNQNVFVGSHSGFNMHSGSQNTYLGFHAGDNDSITNYNVCVGSGAGFKNVAGYATFVGTNAGYNNTIGTQNTFVGLNSGLQNVTGSNNTFLGYYSGYNNTGGNNLFIGESAGLANTSGSSNVAIGKSANFGSAALTNAIAIGSNAIVNTSNSMVLGNGVNVGIGQSSPGFPLNLASSLGDKISLYGNSGAHYGFGIQSALLQVHSASSVDDIAFGYGSSASFSERMRIKGNGKVGIGTSTPGNLLTSAILEIADSTGANKDVVIRTTNSSNTWQALAFARTRGTFSVPVIVQNNDNLGRVSGMAYDGSFLQTAAEIQYHVDSIPGAGNMPGNMTFHTTPSNSNSNCIERMRIDHFGNVGIGTSSPSAKLDVAGAVKIVDGTQGTGKVLTSDVAGLSSWQSLSAGTVGAWGLTGNSGTSPASNYIGTSDNNDVVFKSNNLESFRIRINQRIGMGTAFPTQKLDVQGSINIMADSSYRINNKRALSIKGQTSLSVGEDAGINLGIGYQNVFAGTHAGYSQITGNSNSFIGAFSGASSTTGDLNTYTGANSGFRTTSANYNSFFGAQAGYYNQTGSYNTYLGNNAGFKDSLTNYNVCVGSQAGYNNIVGYATFVGTNAGKNNSTGVQNTFVGLNSGFNNVTGGYNTFLGYYSGYNNTGSNNLFIGESAGLTNTTGSDNITIGKSANVGSANLSNAIAIGNNAVVNTSNSMVLGNGVNVGIGTSSPLTELQVNGGISIMPNTTITATSSNFAVTVGNNSYLRINSNDIPANRALVLSDGLQQGQILMIECTSIGNGIRIADNAATNNTNTVVNRDLNWGDVITLLWNGTDWLETSYSDN